MEIGKKIKESRKKLGLTQDELAKKLNVARTTVANWEQERNYPDIKLIRELSKVLEISVEELMNKSVQEASNDNKKKNKRFKRVIVITLICVITLAFLGGMYNKFEYKVIEKENQIVAAEVFDNDIFIKVNLPIYRSVVGGVVYPTKKADSIKIEIGTKIDLSMKNNNNVEIEIVPEMLPISIENIKHIYFIDDKNKKYAHIKLTNNR